MNGKMEHALKPVEEAFWRVRENQRWMKHMVASHVPEILVKVYPAMLMNAQVNLMLMCRISIYPQNK